MAVDFRDCSVGEAVFFRKTREPRGTKPVPGLRLGQIVARNPHNHSVNVEVRIVQWGVHRFVVWSVTPEEIDRFAT